MPRMRDQHDRQKRIVAVRSTSCLVSVFAAPVPVFRQQRDERLREGAFGEQPAQQVGQPEGDEEGVGHHAGAEGTGDDEVADEAEDAGKQSHAADRGQRAQ